MTTIDELAQKLVEGAYWQDALPLVEYTENGEKRPMQDTYIRDLQVKTINKAYNIEKNNGTPSRELIGKYATIMYVSSMTPFDNYNKAIKLTKNMFKTSNKIQELQEHKPHKKNKIERLERKYEDLTSQLKKANY